MDLKEFYKENFSIDEIALLIKAYSTIIYSPGDDMGCIPQLESLMEAFKEKMDEKFE